MLRIGVLLAVLVSPSMALAATCDLVEEQAAALTLRSSRLSSEYPFTTGYICGMVEQSAKKPSDAVSTAIVGATSMAACSAISSRKDCTFVLGEIVAIYGQAGTVSDLAAANACTRASVTLPCK